MTSHSFIFLHQGKMFLFIGLLMAVVQGGYVRRIPQGKEKATILRGLLIIVPSFAIIGFAQSKVHYYILHRFSVSSKVVVIVCVSLFHNYLLWIDFAFKENVVRTNSTSLV